MTHWDLVGFTSEVFLLWHDSCLQNVFILLKAWRIHFSRESLQTCVYYDMTHAYPWDATCMDESCHTHKYLSYVPHKYLSHVHVRDMTHSYVWHDFFLTDVFWLKYFSHVPHIYFSHNPHFSKTETLCKNESWHTYEWVMSRTCSCESRSRHFRTNQQTSGNCTYLSGKTNKIEYICEDGLAGGQADNGVYYLAKFLECVCVLQCVSVCCSVL